MKNLLAAILLILFTIISGSLAWAQRFRPDANPAYSLVNTGTGFFVNNSGHIVTNEHVVQNCKSIHIRGSVNSDRVRLVATNKDYDLAVLLADKKPGRAAGLRYNSGLKPNDQVMIIGYPGNTIFSGKYTVSTATIVDVKGPNGERGLLQFSDSAMQGNSGGPLLDANGNVIGVITGKLITFDGKGNKTAADVAINMPILKKFLDSNSVQYNNIMSYSELLLFRDLDAKYIEKTAKNFVAGIICVQ